MWFYDNGRPATKTAKWYGLFVLNAVFNLIGWFIMGAGTYAAVVQIRNDIGQGNVTSSALPDPHSPTVVVADKQAIFLCRQQRIYIVAKKQLASLTRLTAFGDAIAARMSPCRPNLADSTANNSKGERHAMHMLE